MQPFGPFEWSISVRGRIRLRSGVRLAEPPGTTWPGPGELPITAAIEGTAEPHDIKELSTADDKASDR